MKAIKELQRPEPVLEALSGGQDCPLRLLLRLLVVLDAASFVNLTVSLCNQFHVHLYHGTLLEPTSWNSME